MGARLEQRPALALAETRPEARRCGRVVARAGEQPHRQTVGLDLGLLEHARVAPELLRQPAIDPRRVEPCAVAQDIVRQFVRDRRCEFFVVGRKFDESLVDEHHASVGDGAGFLVRLDAKVAGASGFGHDADRAPRAGAKRQRGIGGQRREVSFDCGDPRKGVIAATVGDGRFANSGHRCTDADPRRCGRRCGRQRGDEGMCPIIGAIDAERLVAPVLVVKTRVAPDPAELRLAHRAPGGVFSRQAKTDRRHARLRRRQRGIGRWLGGRRHRRRGYRQHQGSQDSSGAAQHRPSPIKARLSRP